MMKTVFASISLLALLSVCPARKVCAAPKKNPLTPKEWLALKEVSQEEIKTAFKAFLKDTNQKFPTPTAWGPTIYKIKAFCDHPFIEADTGFQRKWFQSIYKGVMELVKIQNTKRMCRIAGNKKLYEQMDARFDTTKDKLANLMKHPAKIDQKRVVELQKTAYKKRLALRKKLEESGWDSESTDPPAPPPPTKKHRTKRTR